MTRRRAVLTIAVASTAAAFADERSDLLEIVSPLASALSNGDADAFLRLIPDDSPNRTQLVDNIRALLAQAEMTCSIELRKYDQTMAELDWYMEIRSRATASIIERRKRLVTVRLRDRAIFALEPVDFFKPATVR